MECKIQYNNLNFSSQEDLYKYAVDNNIKELLSVKSKKAVKKVVKKDTEEEYYTITPSKTFEGKTDILKSLGIQKGKFGYYYILDKNQEKKINNYLVKARGKFPKKGLNISRSSDDSDVYLKTVNGKQYLYVDLKQYVEDEGVFLPKIYGQIRMKIDLIHENEIDAYIASFKSDTPYIPEYERELRKHLFKVIGVSAPKAANYYLFNIKDEILKLLRSEGMAVDYSIFSEMDEETVEKIKGFLNIEDKVEKIKAKYQVLINEMTGDDLRTNVMNMLIDNYDEVDTANIWSILNYLPDSFLRLISFNYVNDVTAFFKGGGDKNEDVGFNIKDILKTKGLIDAMATNVALRDMKFAGLLSDSDIDQLNLIVKQRFDLAVKNNRRANIKIGNIYNVDRSSIRKWNAIQTFKPDLFEEFLRYHQKASNTIKEYITRQNKGVDDIVKFLEKSSRKNLNKVWTEVMLGNFEKTEKSFNFLIDHGVIAAHELGHALDFYITSTNPEISNKIRFFVNELIELPEFQEYIEKGLESRGYHTTDKKEIIADLFAWMMSRGANNYTGKSHIKSLDDFMEANIEKVEKLFKDIFEIKEKSTSVKKTPISVKELGIIEYIRNLIKEMIAWVNKKLGRNHYKLSETGIEEVKDKPSLSSIDLLLNMMDKILLRDSNFDINSILDSNTQDSFWDEKVSNIINEDSKPDNVVNAQLKLITALQKTPRKSYPSNSTQGFYNDLIKLGTPKAQIDILKKYIADNKITDINTDDLIASLLADISYIIEINTTTEIKNTEHLGSYDRFELNGDNYTKIDTWRKNNEKITKEEYSKAIDEYRLANPVAPTPTGHYANLTVPGGINYTENEIATPGIVPAKKGHGKFSTNNGIGWFRSDEQIHYKQLSDEEFFTEEGINRHPTFNTTKTRRVLEVQSEFQKTRNKEDLVVHIKTEEEKREFLSTFGGYDLDINEGIRKNQFLQLLNKENNWVTFFIKAIIQDSAKRGYEKVLFPLGNTASKVEGHEVLEDYIAFRENRIADNLKKIDEINKTRYSKWSVAPKEYPDSILNVFDTLEEAKSKVIDPQGRNNESDYIFYPENKEADENIADLERESAQFERELGEAQSGEMKFSTIANFYEVIITNVLKKNGYNPTKVTDEYGNTWNEVSLNNPKALELISFNKKDTRVQDVWNSTFTKQLLDYLQKKDIIAKKEFPAGSGNFYVKKTILGQDRSRYAPEEVERRNIEKILEINQKLGFNAISTVQVGNGLVVKINAQLSMFDHFDDSMLDFTKPTQADIEFMDYNILTNNARDFVDNIYRVGLMFNKPDLINIGTILKEHEDLLASVTIQIYDEENWKLLNGEAAEYTYATYVADTNTIRLAKHHIDNHSMEFNIRMFMEEFLHALTVQPFHKKDSGIPLNKQEKEFVDEITKLYNYYKSKAHKLLQRDYRFINEREFIIGLTLDKRFKEHLEYIDEGNPGFLERIIRDFINAVLKFFGIKTKKDIQPFEKLTINYINQYISTLNEIKPLKITTDNQLISDSRNIRVEKEKLKESLTEEQKEKIKDKIKKFVIQMKSISSKSKGIDIKNPMFQMSKDYDKYHENDIDMIDYFFNFTRELNKIYTNLLNQMNNLKNDQNLESRVKLDKMFRTMATTRQFDATLEEFREIKVDVFVDKEISNDIAKLIEKRSDIEEVYSMSVFPMVVDLFTNIAQPAVEKELKFLDDEIAYLQGRVAIREKSGDKSRADQIRKNIQKKIEERNRKSSETKERVQDYLRGIMGDSSTFTSLIEATIVNPNIIPSGLTKYIKDNLHKSDEAILRRANAAQTELDLYEKESGISRNDLEAFNRPLLDTYDVVESYDEEGNFVTKKKLALLSPWNMDYILELQKFSYINNRLKDKIKRTTDPEEIKKLKRERDKNTQDRLKFIRDYMETKYLPEVHAAMDLIHEDLGGFTAYEMIGDLYDQERDIEEDIERTSDEALKDELYNSLDNIKFKLKKIRSTYEKDPNSKEYKVAQQLKKRDEALKEFRKFVLTPSGAAKFKLEKERIDTQYENGEITEKDKNYWYQHNTITALSEDYWKTKLGIIEQMNNLLTELNASQEKNEDVNKLYKEIENIVKPYRDENGVIQGNKFNDKQVGDVKELEEKIEKLKDSVANIFGLSKTERIELANLNQELERNDEESQSEYDLARLEFLKKEQIRIERRIDQITAKKKKFNKRLLNKYFDLMKKLSLLDTTTETHYYTERREQEFNKYVETQSLDGMGDKFTYNKIVYEKINKIWYAKTKKKSLKILKIEAEKIFKTKKAELTFEESEWYKNNHITKMQWVKSDYDYDPYNIYATSGTWEETTEPIYIWRQSNPTDPKHKVPEQPSLKYKTAVIKDGREPGEKNYRNPNYKLSINGYNTPKRIGPDGKLSKYVNQRYLALENSTDRVDKARLRYLNFFTKNYFEDQVYSYIPQNIRPGYDMPSIRKSTQERIQATSVGEAVSQVGQYVRGLKDETVKNEQDKDILYGYLDNKGMIAVKFQGEIDIEDQTIDIFRSLGMYHVASQHRMRLGDTWSLAASTLDILKDPNNTPTKQKNGRVVSTIKKYLPRNTEVAKYIEGNGNTLKQVNEIYNYYYLGERIKDERGSKGLNFALGAGATLMLGINFTSMIQNWTNAKIQSILELENSVSKNFTMKDWAMAEAEYWANIGGLMSDLGKYGNKSYINQFVDYFGGINFNIINTFDTTPAYKGLTKTLAKMLMPMEIAEHQLSYALFMAIAMNTKVNYEVNGEISQIPLFDAFTMGETGIELKEGVKLSQTERDDFINKVNSSARRINGEYGNLDLVVAQKFMLGRLFLFMNKYFIPFFQRRFAKRRFNIQDGLQDDGFYLSFFKTIGNDIKNFNFNILKNWKDYTPSQKAATRQTGTEISISMLLIAMIAMLGGDDDKELKDNGLLANNIIYVLKGIKRQNEQFMLVPGLGLDDVYNRMKNPFPIMTKVGQAFAVLNDMVYLAGYSMGINELKDIQYTKKSGWHNKGDLKIWSDVGKLLAGPKRLQQYLHPDIAIKNLEAYRIK